MIDQTGHSEQPRSVTKHLIYTQIDVKSNIAMPVTEHCSHRLNKDNPMIIITLMTLGAASTRRVMQSDT